MNIIFSTSSYGQYGGGLNTPLRYLGNIISDRFLAEDIKLPFERIEIQLAFFTSRVKKEEYITWYNKLPIYYRRKEIVIVTLPMSGQKNNLSDVFLQVYKTFDLISSKKKKDDITNYDKIKSTLLRLEEELKSIDLLELQNKYQKLIRQKEINLRLQERQIREQENKEKKRLIADIRFYYNFENIGKQYFSPYSSELCNKILEKLRKRKFRLPDYTHLYINVSDTFENALEHAVRAENWFIYGVAVLKDYINYPTKGDNEKKRIVFDLIKEGLRDIAQIDKLNTETLNKVFDEIELEILQ